MQWTIRDGRPSDWPVIVDFNRLLALESEEKVLDLKLLSAGVRRLLADDNLGRYFVAESDGRVIAQTMVTCEWSDWRNGMFWWLQSVYVEVPVRGRGIFRGLYRHIEQLARNDGTICGIRLYVDQRNTSAHGVYETLGLKPAGYFVLEKLLTPE